MEIIYLLHILGRHIGKILLISILVTVGAFSYVTYGMAPEYKNTMVFSTTTKIEQNRIDEADYDPLAYFEAADRFAEAILGWFRSPILFQDLKAQVPSAAPLALDGIIKVRKQEKQNLNILFTVPERQTAEELGSAIESYLRDRVTRVNTAGNTTYDLVDFQSTIEETKPSSTLTAAMAGAGTLLFLCMIALLWDLVRGVVLYPQQAEEILKTKSLGSARDKEDIHALAAFVAKQEHPVAVVQTSDTKNILAMDLAQYSSTRLGKKTLLIEGEQQGTRILKQAGISDRLRKVKGFFDGLSLDEMLSVAIPLVPEQPLLRFIGSGEGEAAATEHLSTLRTKNDVVLLSTSLPQNPYILMEKECTLVVVVKPGATRLKTLRHIARMSDAPCVLFFA